MQHLYGRRSSSSSEHPIYFNDCNYTRALIIGPDTISRDSTIPYTSTYSTISGVIRPKSHTTCFFEIFRQLWHILQLLEKTLF